MKYTILIISVIQVFIMSFCTSPKEDYINITGFVQGSTYSIKYGSRPKYDPDEIRAGVAGIFRDVDKSLSVYNDSSIISRINAGQDVTTDSLFNEVYRKSMEISAETDGAFDITVMPLVRAWGFGPDKHKTFDRSKLDSLLDLTGFRKVSLTGNRVIKSRPGMKLDVNAIAQGYTVDLLCRYFDIHRIKNYLVEVGGEVRARGKKNGELWRIGIDKPVDNNMLPGDDLQAIIKLNNKALATSGNYRKFYIEDGIKYSHEIDPKTGYPVKNRVLSASIIADECATADAIATACMVMGLEKSISFIENRGNIMGYLVYSDDQGHFLTWISEDLKSYIEEEASVNTP